MSQEIKSQINRLKKHKSPDEDIIQREMLKYLDETMVEKTHKVTEIICNTEEISKDWNARNVKTNPLSYLNY